MSQQINLFNPAFIPPREYLTATSVAVAAGVVLVLLGLGTGYARRAASEREATLRESQSQLASVQTTIEALRQTLASRAVNPELTREIQQIKAEIALRERILAVHGEYSLQPGLGYAEYLRGLARQTPGGVWITGLSLSERGDLLAISGRTQDKSLLPDFVQRLKREPAFAGKAFGGIKLNNVALEAPNAVLSNPRPVGAVAEPAGAGRGDASPRVLEFQLLANRVDKVVSVEKAP